MVGWGLAQRVVDKTGFSAYRVDVDWGLNFLSVDLLNNKPLGQGQIPVPQIVAPLKAEGYDGYIVLETGHFCDHHASAKASGDYLKSLV